MTPSEALGSVVDRLVGGVMFHSESDQVSTDAEFIYDDFVSKL